MTGASPQRLAGGNIDHCPVCRSGGVQVIDSRPSKLGRRRRRHCPGCGHRWSTQEIPMELANDIAAARKALLQAMAAIDVALSAFEPEEEQASGVDAD